MADNLILIWQTALKWAVTALLAGGVSFVTVRWKLRKERKSNESKAFIERLEALDKRDEVFAGAIRSMLRQSIINTYDRYTLKGWAKVYVKDNVQEMYDCYHALGGNGTITHLVDEFMNLPTREEDRK